MIKIGLLGTGYISEVHASAAKDVEKVSITSVFSRNKKRAKDFAEKFGIPNFFDDYISMLSSGEIDAVIIGVPTPFHKEFALKAFEASKHVLCEKPIALTLEDSNEMLRNAEKNSVILMIAQVLRFWPEYVAVKKLIEDNSIGRIKNIYTVRFSTTPAWSENNWLLNPSQSGGVPVDIQIHDFDFIRWILGEPLSIYAVGSLNEKGLIINSGCVFQYSDSIAVSEAGYVLPRNSRFEMGFKLIAESAVIEYNNLREPTLIIKRDNGSIEAIQIENKNAYSEQISYFAECAANKINPNRIKTSDAIKSLSLSLRVKSLIDSQIENTMPLNY